MESGAADVTLELHGSRIVIGRPLTGAGASGIREAIAGRRAAIITDSNVAPLHAVPLAARIGVDAAAVLTIPAGEGSKTRDEWARLTDALLARGFGRDSVIVAVGGGVVGDLAGFVAATFMRGIPVIQVPTTLLAMVDAAVGGKTGVDAPAGKNLVGAFHRPLLVVADPATLATLPDVQFRNGLAETLKHALITSASEVRWLVDRAPLLATGEGRSATLLADLVERNVRIKADIVARDERESGPRKMLNFGHTIGHAVESVSGFAILHGECVGIGMRAEAMIASKLGLAAPVLADQITAALGTLGLPLRPLRQLDLDAIIAATRSDKKSRGGAVEYALLADIGEAANPAGGYGTPVPEGVAREAIADL
jgi:3-dehydroquinate synthase